MTEDQARREERARQCEEGKQKFLAMVKQRPDTEYGVRNLPPCPHCGVDWSDEQKMDLCETLLGSISIDTEKHPEQDPNHKWRYVECRECHEHYTIESKYANVWVTIGLETPIRAHLDNEPPKERLVVRGLPSCYESYVYDCALCHGGHVRREYYKLHEDVPLHAPNDKYRMLTTIPAKGGKQYRATWVCDKCNARIITPEFDHYFTCPPPPDLSPEEKEYARKVAEAFRQGTIFTTTGPAIGDLKGLARAKF